MAWIQALRTRDSLRKHVRGRVQARHTHPRAHAHTDRVGAAVDVVVLFPAAAVDTEEGSSSRVFQGANSALTICGCTSCVCAYGCTYEGWRMPRRPNRTSRKKLEIHAQIPHPRKPQLTIPHLRLQISHETCELRPSARGCLSDEITDLDLEAGRGGGALRNERGEGRVGVVW